MFKGTTGGDRYLFNGLFARWVPATSSGEIGRIVVAPRSAEMAIVGRVGHLLGVHISPILEDAIAEIIRRERLGMSVAVDDVRLV